MNQTPGESAQKSMKAVLLNGYGGVEQLTYGDVPDSKAGPGEVLIKVAATSLNPLDWKLRAGYLKAVMPLPLPFILGSDVSGTVLEVGSGVTQFKKGDRVLGFVQHGYAELLATKPETLALVPEGMDLEDAAAIPVVGTTGAELIEEAVKIKASQRVLVTGALGSVGRVAVYVAKLHNAIVIAGVRQKQKAEATMLGADQVIAVDDDREIAGLPDLDAVADTVGGAVIEKLVPKIKKGGAVGSIVGKVPSAEKAGLRVGELYAHPDAKRLAALAEDVRAGDLVIPISKKFKLSQASEAHAFAEKGGVGKVLLIP